MKVDSVYSSRIWFGCVGLNRGFRLKAACANTSSTSASRNKPAA